MGMVFEDFADIVPFSLTVVRMYHTSSNSTFKNCISFNKIEKQEDNEKEWNVFS